MQIRDVMTKDVISVAPTDSLKHAAELMQHHDIGSLPVCSDGKVEGIITDRDLLTRGVATGKNPSKTPVSDCMTSPAVKIQPSDDPHGAAMMMSRQRIRRLPVVDNQQLVGIVSLGDLACRCKEECECANTLDEICTKESN